MLKYLPQTEDPSAAGPAADRVAFVRKLGGTVWAEMERYGIVPTPRAYEAWFAYRTGMNPGLSQRVGELLGAGKALTPAVLDTFHDEFVAGIEVDADAINGKADELQHAAQTLADQVAGNQAAITGYGNMLTHWAEHLNGETTIGGLVGAVRTLTAETIRAAERNRALEQQLSTSIGRIARLRQSLADVKQEATRTRLRGSRTAKRSMPNCGAPSPRHGPNRQFQHRCCSSMWTISRGSTIRTATAPGTWCCALLDVCWPTTSRAAIPLHAMAGRSLRFCWSAPT